MKINWYQTIPELGIKGRYNTPEEFAKIGLPEDMTGWSVLDIGCNTGAFLIEAYKRGATELYGVEVNLAWRILAQGCWWEYLRGWPPSDNSDIDFIIQESIWAAEFAGDDYDLVLLLSVLHVTENPQELLDRAWELADKLLIVEINKRLQKTPVKLPNGAKLYGVNKDGREVYHCIKSY